MANLVDPDQQWLLNCLNATLDPNQDVRSFAETSLNQASYQPGFGAALAKVSANREIPFGIRQLAAVLLKQFVKKHWQEDEETFEHPIVSSEEKVVIRRHLMLSLDDPHRKICTAISMAVSSIAQYDWPEDWPDLLPFLLKLVGDQNNMSGVHGALRCLALLSADLDDSVVPKLVPVLFPCLLSIISSPQLFDKSLRKKALSIVYSCISMLGIMSAVYKKETTELVMQMVRPLLDQFSLILDHPVEEEDSDDWNIRIEVLKCLNQFAQNFSSLAEKELTVVMGPLWKTFVSSFRVYERSSIKGESKNYEGDRYDSDGVEVSLESLIVQLFELLLTIVGSIKLAKVISNDVKELVYYTVAFLQMTEQEVHIWSLDANQYIADEDDNTYNCRASGALLLEEVVSRWQEDGIEAIVDTAKRHIVESRQEKAAGSPTWWRIREAILFSLASVSEHLIETEESGLVKADLRSLVEHIITEATVTGINDHPFLNARVLMSIGKFSPLVSHQVVENCLFSAVKAVGMNVPPPLKVGACRALSQLLPDSNKDILQPHILHIFSSLTDLLNQASDETLHLVLETLQAAVKACLEASASVEPIISPIVLNIWVSHVSDPFISIDAVEVLEAIKNAPACIHPLVSRVLPYIGPILSKHQQQSDGLVAGSLDLITMLLKNAPTDIVKAIYDVCFDPIVQILLQSDDHSELQNATECLACILNGGRQEVLAWGSDSGLTIRSLLNVASRLLDPNLESSGSLYVGSFLLQLVLHFPSQILQHIRDLVAGIVGRMQTCQIAGLKSSLILVFARLVHMSAPDVGLFIDLLLTIPAEGHNSSFAYVMSEWTKQQGEIQGSYQIKVTTTALALLLSTRHVELPRVHVQGHLVKSSAGIVTRSKAKSAPDMWITIPLPAKILALLADALIEMQEQVTVGGYEDSDWEETEGGEIEADEVLRSSSIATSGGRTPYDQLEAMAKIYNENQEDDLDGLEDDMLSSSDPLNEINLANYLVDFLSKFIQADRHLFDKLYQALTLPQQNAIQIVLKR